MTGDDGGWEQYLRSGLSTLLGDVVPAAPPIAAVRRHGRVRRAIRRLTTAVAVLLAAAVIIAMVALPRLAGRHAPLPGDRTVIAQGVIEGRAWRIVVERPAGLLCAGEAGLRQSCVALRSLEHLSGPASLSGAMVAEDLRPAPSGVGPGTWDALFGVVRPGVTKVVLSLSANRLAQVRPGTEQVVPRYSTITLHPVAAAGYRWVGLMFRFLGFSIDQAVAYLGPEDLSYAMPSYGARPRPGTYFTDWLRARNVEPTAHSTSIAVGGPDASGWSASVESGPWGYCVSLNAPVADGTQQACWSLASLQASARVIMWYGSPPAMPRWVVGTARPSVAYLRMTLANGRAMRVPVTVFSGQGFYAMQIGPGPAVVRWAACDSAGHELYGGSGPPGG